MPVWVGLLFIAIAAAAGGFSAACGWYACELAQARKRKRDLGEIMVVRNCGDVPIMPGQMVRVVETRQSRELN